MSGPDLSTLPGLILNDGEPIFSQPWEARAFALVIGLHERGVFSWDEWAQALSAEIHNGEDRPYYRHWLAALEALMATKAIATPTAIEDRERDWHEAAARTPHGEPIEL